ncbi:MAG: hypothetical protein ACXW5U_14710 [Thermoanaerobaculia bacterium]
MQLRLVYRGPLPAAKYSGGGTRAKEKHNIRRELHKQLREFWRVHPGLRDHMEPTVEGRRTTVDAQVGRAEVDRMADEYARCGYRFLPLIGGAFSGRQTACALDILFLRRDSPGSLIKSGGDIDNRLKTLFDALRIPQNCDELKGFSPSEDEDPFYCLMEDDSLIVEVKVTTDRLLTPLSDAEHINDVVLIINATSIVTSFTKLRF